MLVFHLVFKPGTLIPPLVLFGLSQIKTPTKVAQIHRAMIGNMLSVKILSQDFC